MRWAKCVFFCGSIDLMNVRTVSVSILRAIRLKRGRHATYMTKARDGNTPTMSMPPSGCSLRSDGQVRDVWRMRSVIGFQCPALALLF
jgi:hypothetical protein